MIIVNIGEIMKNNKSSGQVLRQSSGQAIIVVLLIIVVALTIGLSVTMRSIKDIKMSTRTEESQRAFSAAEAGLEAALLSGTDVPLTGLGSGGDLDYVATVSQVGGTAEFVFPDKIDRDDTQQIWFVAHNPTTKEIELSCPPTLPNIDPCYSGNNLDIYWGNVGSSTTIPALEASLIYYNAGNFGIKKYTFDPNGGRAAGNHFSNSVFNAGYTIDSKSIQYKSSITDLAGSGLPIALRLRLLYNNETHWLGAAIPSPTSEKLAYQGDVYKSVGKAKVSGSAETETRTISFIKSYPTLPGIFDFALFSNSSLSKP